MRESEHTGGKEREGSDPRCFSVQNSTVWLVSRCKKWRNRNDLSNLSQTFYSLLNEVLPLWNRTSADFCIGWKQMRKRGCWLTMHMAVGTSYPIIYTRSFSKLEIYFQYIKVKIKLIFFRNPYNTSVTTTVRILEQNFMLFKTLTTALKSPFIELSSLNVSSAPLRDSALYQSFDRLLFWYFCFFFVDL